MNIVTIDIGRLSDATAIQQMYLDALRYVCGLFSYKDGPSAEDVQFPGWLAEIEDRYSYEYDEFHILVDFILEQYTDNSHHIYSMIVAGTSMGEQ